MSQPGDKEKPGQARGPPPTLFLHPSPTASHVSLPGIMASSVPPPSVAAAQGGQPLYSRNNPLIPRNATGSTASPTDSRRPPVSLRPPAPHPTDRVLSLPPSLPRRESTRATDRTDALWAEMQATLEEVELSASGGTRVFGADHDHKLSELRAAQIALAQAWARSEADEAIETMGTGGLGEVRNLKASGGATAADGTGAADGKADGTDPARSTGAGGSGQPASSGGQEKLGSKLEEETEVDILLARKRREANDRYFQRVSQGVLDVVAKLEEVAIAMRAVEQESKDIWGEGEDESLSESARMSQA